jgi:hypothetical protein
MLWKRTLEAILTLWVPILLIYSDTSLAFSVMAVTGKRSIPLFHIIMFGDSWRNTIIRIHRLPYLFDVPGTLR